MKVLKPSDVSPQELDRLVAFVSSLPAGSALRAALDEMIVALHTGIDVIVGTPWLTPSEASRVLGFSRTHLNKLLDAGEVPFRRVGRDRRIALLDVLALQRKLEQSREEMRERFADSAAARGRAKGALFS